MEWKEFTAKTVDEALTHAMLDLKTTEDNLEYEIIERESSGFLGLFSKPAIIRVREKSLADDIGKVFLERLLDKMGVEAEVISTFDEENNLVDMNIKGEDMGIVIGKRGTTLDSIQYLTSLVINKNCENYIKVKLDTEDYRARRKETLENLARNIASKVKRTRKSVTLEPMNPYERRIIHSALQSDKSIDTFSVGDDPYRKVVISNKKKSNRSNKSNHNENYSNDYRRDYKKYKESKKNKLSQKNS